MRARGRSPILRWVTAGPPTTDVELHADYSVGSSFVYVQALRQGGWRAFVGAPDNDAQALIAVLEEMLAS